MNVSFDEDSQCCFCADFKFIRVISEDENKWISYSYEFITADKTENMLIV